LGSGVLDALTSPQGKAFCLLGLGVVFGKKLLVFVSRRIVRHRNSILKAIVIAFIIRSLAVTATAQDPTPTPPMVQQVTIATGDSAFYLPVETGGFLAVIPELYDWARGLFFVSSMLLGATIYNTLSRRFRV
jgi:hypothetical protein